MTAKKTKLIPAVARLDAKPRKQTKRQRMSQQRQIAAWASAAERKTEGRQR